MRPSLFRSWIPAAAAALAVFGSTAAVAADSAASWPHQPVTMILGFPAGSGVDVIARGVQEPLSQRLGQPLIIDYKSGAAGNIASEIVARAKPDGYTLAFGTAATHGSNAALYKKLPFDVETDFVPVAPLIDVSNVLTINPNVINVKNLKEFVDEIKANPGKYNYASAGNGSATHLAMASFLAKAGLQMTHIPTKSTGEAVNEVLAGRVQAVISSSIGVMGFQSDPRMKLLASTGQSRSPFLPKLPTVAESGLPGYAFDSWIGLLAPAATPKAEVERLNAAVNKVIADPAIQERFTRLGVEPRSQSVEEFQKLLRADWDAMGAVVKASGAKVD